MKFFISLRELGFNLIEHSFPDHYQFDEDDFLFSEKLPIIMTEIDAARCSNMKNNDIWYLKTEASLPSKFASSIANKIKEKTK